MPPLVKFESETEIFDVITILFILYVIYFKTFLLYALNTAAKLLFQHNLALAILDKSRVISLVIIRQPDI